MLASTPSPSLFMVDRVQLHIAAASKEIPVIFDFVDHYLDMLLDGYRLISFLLFDFRRENVQQRRHFCFL